MSTLSTHVLDTSRGTPAAGVRIRLLQDGQPRFDGHTNADGRCPELAALQLDGGRYRLEFAVADYLRAAGQALAEPPFLDVVPIDFGIAAAGHYHVPLLLSAYGYSTYRGS
jgi:5-hydroxyisourate hydrolase